MKKIRVLLAGHIGEPKGGISTYYESILGSDLKNYVDINFVETSRGNLQVGERGKWGIGNWINAFVNVVHFLTALVKVKPDLVHIGTAYQTSFLKHSIMMCVARLFGIPVILQIHCSFYKLLPEGNSFWKKYVLFILNQCAGIIVLSKEWEQLAALVPGIKIRCIPNAIDIKPYLQLPRSRDEAERKVNILYLGHIHRDKGLLDLVNAVALMNQKTNPEFLINIVGEAYSEEELRNVSDLISSNHLQEAIKIFAPEYGEKKIDRFASSDIFVLPSHHEGMPVSIIEAMAAGLPVVASKVGGIPDLVENRQNGMLINPGDVNGLKAALVELVQSPEKRLALGMDGRRKAKGQFDIQWHVDALNTFYREIVPAR